MVNIQIFMCSLFIIYLCTWPMNCSLFNIHLLELWVNTPISHPADTNDNDKKILMTFSWQSQSNDTVPNHVWCQLLLWVTWSSRVALTKLESKKTVLHLPWTILLSNYDVIDIFLHAWHALDSFNSILKIHYSLFTFALRPWIVQYSLFIFKAGQWIIQYSLFNSVYEWMIKAGGVNRKCQKMGHSVSTMFHDVLLQCPGNLLKVACRLLWTGDLLSPKGAIVKCWICLGCSAGLSESVKYHLKVESHLKVDWKLKSHLKVDWKLNPDWKLSPDWMLTESWLKVDWNRCKAQWHW